MNQNANGEVLANEQQPPKETSDESDRDCLFRRGYPKSLEKREQALRYSDPRENERFKVGVALSGGGVRSATFSFGILQAIAARNAIRDIDILSTVSGGGYTGSLLNRLFTRDEVCDVDDVQRAILPAQDTKEGSPDRQCKGRKEIKSGAALDWLRENGHHLAPNGAGDLLLGGAVIVRNWLTVQFVLGSFLLTCFMALHLLRGALNSCPLLAGYGHKLKHWLLSQLPLADTVLSWSPWIVVPAAVLIVTTIPFGIAYWLSTAYVKSSFRPSSLVACVALLLLLGAIGAIPVFLFDEVDALGLGALLTVGRAPAAAFAVATWTALLVAALIFLVIVVGNAFRKRGGDSTVAELGVAHRLSVCLKISLIVFAATFMLAMVDTLGASIHENWNKLATLVAPTAGLVAIGILFAAAGGRRITLALLQGTNGTFGTGTKTSASASVIAGFVLFGVLTAVNTISHAAVELGHGKLSVPLAPGTVESLVWLLVLLALSLLMGHSARFLNDSTLQPLYRARLARAYLGASNPNRIVEGNPVTQVIEGDDCPVFTGDSCNRTPYGKGAPLHLINVTINETLDGKSRLQRNDRKGIGMAVGPAGISAGVKHHMVYRNGRGKKPEVFPKQDAFAMFDSSKGGETLTLGQWTGISGAAFSTGLGSRTAFGLSFLAAFANVRLGYWWDSQAKPGSKYYDKQHNGRRKARQASRFGDAFTTLFPVQSHLIDEFLGRFHGTGRIRWNLSDGGHFENMGAYELIRRRVRLIVIVDSEADPDYEFEGLGNFVRKARLDFGAEIRFLGRQELDQLANNQDRHGSQAQTANLKYVGTLSDLGAASTVAEGSESVDQHDRNVHRSRAHAALAQVRYDGEPQVRSWIVYVKPTLAGDEPVDIANYRATYPSFPQQTTKDQFFDEPQWESYRKLGELIGRRVFAGDTQPFEAFISLLRHG